MAITEKRKKVMKFEDNAIADSPNGASSRAKETEEYEITFTGKDVGAAMGWFDKEAQEAKQKDVTQNESTGLLRMSTPDGGVTEVRADREGFYKEHGYGRHRTKSMFVMPGLPWQKDKFADVTAEEK